ncbi:hypothetical protein BY458DRAFT_559214 [Sporodiniella umbellata]|nr:hypothetical protein BY458DRAFT_559214 [Sporodiniella umbellata]
MSMSSTDSMKYFLRVYKLSAKKESEMKNKKVLAKDMLDGKVVSVVTKNVPLIRRYQVNKTLNRSARFAKRAAAQVEQEAEEKRRARLEEERSRSHLKRKREEDDIAEERLHKRQRV